MKVGQDAGVVSLGMGYQVEDGVPVRGGVPDKG